MQNAATRSPSLTAAPDGALRTTPATSLPGTNGSGGFIWYSPRVWSTSGNETPAACTSTSTPSPGVSMWDGSGSGMSTSFRAPSGPLRSTIWIARMAAFLSQCEHGQRSGWQLGEPGVDDARHAALRGLGRREPLVAGRDDDRRTARGNPVVDLAALRREHRGVADLRERLARAHRRRGVEDVGHRAGRRVRVRGRRLELAAHRLQL